MKILVCILFSLISISSVAETDTESIVSKIENLINDGSDEWQWVQNDDGKYRQFYKREKGEFVDYLRANNPDQVAQTLEYGEDADIKVFLVFQERNKKMYRAGWYYYWAFSDGDRGSCKAYRWDYDYYTYQENGEQWGGGGNAGKGGGCLH